MILTRQAAITETLWYSVRVFAGVFALLVAAILILTGRMHGAWIRELTAIGRRMDAMARKHRDAQEQAVVPEIPGSRFADFDPLVQEFGQMLVASMRAEADAREKAAMAETAIQARNRFIGNISQEIRNPLGGILGSADLLLFRETDPEKRERLRLLRQSAELLRQLIDDVLDVACLDADRFVLVKRSFAVGHLLEDLVLQMGEPAKKKGLSLTMRWDRAIPPRLMGDEDRLRQILFHLLDNAIKFTDEGVVRLSAVREQAPGADGGENGDTPLWILFSVQDTGEGMDPEDSALIFDDFHKGWKRSSMSHTPGTGLGLPICRRLVTAMGGEISFESVRGSGSRFWFRVPLPIDKNRENAGEAPGAAEETEHA